MWIIFINKTCDQKTINKKRMTQDYVVVCFDLLKMCFQNRQSNPGDLFV